MNLCRDPNIIWWHSEFLENEFYGWTLLGAWFHSYPQQSNQHHTIIYQYQNYQGFFLDLFLCYHLWFAITGACHRCSVHHHFHLNGFLSAGVGANCAFILRVWTQSQALQLHYTDVFSLHNLGVPLPRSAVWCLCAVRGTVLPGGEWLIFGTKTILQHSVIFWTLNFRLLV